MTANTTATVRPHLADCDPGNCSTTHAMAFAGCLEDAGCTRSLSTGMRVTSAMGFYGTVMGVSTYLGVTLVEVWEVVDGQTWADRRPVRAHFQRIELALA